MIELPDLSSRNPQCENRYSLEMVEDELKIKCTLERVVWEFLQAAWKDVPYNMPYIILGDSGERRETLERNGLFTALRFVVTLWVSSSSHESNGPFLWPVSHFLNSYNSVSVGQEERIKRLDWEHIMLYKDMPANVSLFPQSYQCFLCWLALFTC